MDKYTVGNCEIEISNCPKIIVNALKLRSHQKTISMDYNYNGHGTYPKSVGPVEWEVNFKISDKGLQDNKQVWFQQFNSKSQISAHLGREKLTLHLDTNYRLTLIGYLMLPSVDSEIGLMWFNFNFNGVVGEDINLVTDIYADSLMGSPYSQEDLEGPTTEELAEDFEFVTKRVIKEYNTSKAKTYKKPELQVIKTPIIIQRKITF